MPDPEAETTETPEEIEAAVLLPAEPEATPSDEEDVGTLAELETVLEGGDGEASEEEEVEAKEEEEEVAVAPLLPNVSAQATMVAGSTALTARKQQERADRLG